MVEKLGINAVLLSEERTRAPQFFTAFDYLVRRVAEPMTAKNRHWLGLFRRSDTYVLQKYLAQEDQTNRCYRPYIPTNLTVPNLSTYPGNLLFSIDTFNRYYPFTIDFDSFLPYSVIDDEDFVPSLASLVAKAPAGTMVRERDTTERVGRAIGAIELGVNLAMVENDDMESIGSTDTMESDELDWEDMDKELTPFLEPMFMDNKSDKEDMMSSLGLVDDTVVTQPGKNIILTAIQWSDIHKILAKDVHAGTLVHQNNEDQLSLSNGYQPLYHWTPFNSKRRAERERRIIEAREAWELEKAMRGDDDEESRLDCVYGVIRQL